MRLTLYVSISADDGGMLLEWELRAPTALDMETKGGFMGVSDVRSGADRKQSRKRGETTEPRAQEAASARQDEPRAIMAESERQSRWIALAVSVGLAVIVPIVRLLWSRVREERLRARLDREILRELGA
jgi:hypothetical protein